MVSRKHEGKTKKRTREFMSEKHRAALNDWAVVRKAARQENVPTSVLDRLEALISQGLVAISQAERLARLAEIGRKVSSGGRLKGAAETLYWQKRQAIFVALAELIREGHKSDRGLSVRVHRRLPREIKLSERQVRRILDEIGLDEARELTRAD